MLWELKSRCIFAQAMTPKQKTNIMNTNKMITILKDQLQTTAISRQVSSLIQNEISRLELTLQTV